MNITELAKEPDKITNPYLQKIYKIVQGRGVHDGTVRHSINDIEEIKNLLFEHVQDNMVNAGEVFIPFETAKTNVRLNLEKSGVKDGFFNPVNGVGTLADPGMWNDAFTPVSMSPQEATSYYASGGIGQRIIDKKSKGALLNDYSFKSNKWQLEDLSTLREYAERVGFDTALVNATRDGYIYGGSIIYPNFKREQTLSHLFNIETLCKKNIIEKDCISYYTTADRWNTVVVPNWIITDKDYLMPDSIYIPLGGIELNTGRASLIKPVPMPYWSTIRQLGWGNSDYEGYVRSLLAYEMIVSSIPIMAQQMSLLFQEFPVDGTIAMNGPDAVKQFFKENEAVMREWSMLHPKAINSFGTIKVIERTYTGWAQLIQSSRLDVSAKSGIPESAIWHTMPTGFGNNDDDMLLKQSETIQLGQRTIAPQLHNNIKILIYSCFGTDSIQAQTADSVKISFEAPVVVTQTAKLKMSEQYSRAIYGLKKSGLSLKSSVMLMQQFAKEIDISKDVMAELDEDYKLEILKAERVRKQLSMPITTETEETPTPEEEDVLGDNNEE